MNDSQTVFLTIDIAFALRTKRTRGGMGGASLSAAALGRREGRVPSSSAERSLSCTSASDFVQVVCQISILITMARLHRFPLKMGCVNSTDQHAKLRSKHIDEQVGHANK
ncbi:hypothetical protein ANCDUO_17053 [Ancylostoma duodenale]|uniref:Uncharacterized protein n=1 Tax=Ancylostoma duodenale TaxID=51022 RepID=A0A0C2CSR6_9BILA|nr:hypothetical protein ANCDUO_17053 [Ancylostoma duodenale]